LLIVGGWLLIVGCWWEPRNRVSLVNQTVNGGKQARNPVSQPPQPTQKQPRNRVSVVDM